MKTVFFIALVAMSHFFVAAQECNNVLKGQVTDYHSKLELDDATIFIIENNRETKTNKNGKFRFDDLCSGTYQIEVSHPECTTIIVDVQVQGTTNIDIKLEHHLEELDEVDVVGDAVRNKTKSAQEEKL